MPTMPVTRFFAKPYSALVVRKKKVSISLARSSVMITSPRARKLRLGIGCTLT